MMVFSIFAFAPVESEGSLIKVTELSYLVASFQCISMGHNKKKSKYLNKKVIFDIIIG